MAFPEFPDRPLLSHWLMLSHIPFLSFCWSNEWNCSDNLTLELWSASLRYKDTQTTGVLLGREKAGNHSGHYNKAIIEYFLEEGMFVLSFEK